MGDTLVEPGGLMERIQSLISPPRCDEKSRGRRPSSTCPPPSNTTLLSARVNRGKSSNHDRCDGCTEGGDLVCCDRCPAAFHLYCCDPPLEAGSLPSGEWLCRKCDPPPPPANDVHLDRPFQTLLERGMKENPVSFSLPSYLLSNSPLGLGRRKRRKSGEESKVHAKHARSDHKEVKRPDHLEGDQTNRRFCALCSKTSRVSLLMQCSFCPLSYHMDCLEPPRTTPPLGGWMCPCHAEHLHPDFSSELLSSKEKLLEKMRSDFNEHTTKIDFLDKVHRMNHHGRRVPHTKRRSLPIPPYVKRLYKSPSVSRDGVTIPSFAELCEAASKARNATDALKPMQGLTYDHAALEAQQQQDEWLRSVIHLQSDIVQFLSLPPDVRQSIRQRGQSDDLSSPYISTTAMLSETSECRDPLGNHLIENGVLSDCEDLCDDPPYRQHKQGIIEVKAQDKLTMNGWSDRDPGVDNGCAVEGMCDKVDRRTVNSQKAVLLDHGSYALPDLSLLESDLVRLLAQQRLQQLLTSDSERSLPKPHSPSRVTSTAKSQHNAPLHPPADVLTRCHAVLCPVGCPGSPYPLVKRVVTLGSSLSCDVSLRHSTTCSRLSETHACIVYDKSVAQFELINYSEYGTHVDGLLYLSSAHCDETRTHSSPVILTTDNVKALGDGPRASRARRRIEMAKSRWKDGKHSKSFIATLMTVSNQENGVHMANDNKVTTTKPSLSPVQTHRSLESGRIRRDPSANEGSSVKVTRNVEGVNKGEAKHNLRPRARNEDSVGPQLSLRKNRNASDVGQTGESGLRCDTLPGTVGGGACGCAGLQSLSSDGGWSGSASLCHGSLIRMGCVQLLLSVAGQPGHAELIQSIVTLRI